MTRSTTSSRWQASGGEGSVAPEAAAAEDLELGVMEKERFPIAHDL
jgi:hypothetical protein